MIMQIQEQRIGNLVYGIYETETGETDQIICRVVAVDETESLGDGWSSIIQRMDDGPEIEEYEDTAPIPLTEEWLIKFGFKREDKAPPTKEHSQYFSKWVMDYKYSFAYAPFREDWGFYHSYTDAPKDEDNDKFDFISCGLKYVHQLQNLYYALTSEELTLSPPQR